MRIAQVTPRYYPCVGGIETAIRQISERLSRQGYEIEVLTEDPRGQFPSEEVFGGVRIQRFRTSFNGWGSCFYQGGLKDYLKKYSGRYDLIHAHSYHAFPALLAAHYKNGTKLVFSGHYHGKGHSWWHTFLLGLYKPLGQQIVRRADRIICYSQYEKLLIIRDFKIDDAKITVLPHGVNPEIEKAVPFVWEGPLLLYVGRLEKYKQIHLALQAFTWLPSNYRMAIIGDGPYKNRLSDLIDKYHLNPRVKILSGLSDEEVFRWYKTCSLVINLSCQEAFGITVLESLAADKPVLVNDETALGELARALPGISAVKASCITSEHLAREIFKANQRAFEIPDLTPYQWDTIASHLGKLYEKVFFIKSH